MRHALASLVLPITIGSTACVLEYHGGAQFLTQSGGPITQSATVGAGAALGDGRGAIGEVVEGSVGVDDRGGQLAGSFVGGLEYSSWGGARDDAHRFALLGGFAATARPHDAAALLVARYSYAWALDQSDDGRGMTSLSLDPSIGMALPFEDGDRPTGVVIGLGLTFRHETFSEWRFHL